MDDEEEVSCISESCRNIFYEKCHQHGVVPIRKVAHMLGTRRLRINFMNVGPQTGLAIAESLKTNTVTEEVELSGNDLGCLTICSLFHNLAYNSFVTYLNISNNDLKTDCIRALQRCLEENTSLEVLDLSENNLTDFDMCFVACALKNTTRLHKLNLSKNKIGQHGAIEISESLLFNRSLRDLNLSWNEIRREAAYHIGYCLSKNKYLEILDLSWNGLAEDGCLGMEFCLSKNTSLLEVNLKCNRINFDAVYRLARGLRKNNTLRVLRIGLNNLSLAGVLDVIDAANSSNSALELIDLEGQYIHSKVLYLIEKVNKLRPFEVIYDKVLDLEDEIYKSESKDPMEFLLEYLADRAIRVVDFFRMIDRSRVGFVSSTVFTRNIIKLKLPLTSMEIKEIVNKIDEDKSGIISYDKVVKKLRDQQKKMRDREFSKKINKQKETERTQLKAHIAHLFDSEHFDQESNHINSHRYNFYPSRSSNVESNDSRMFSGMYSRNSNITPNILPALITIEDKQIQKQKLAKNKLTRSLSMRNRKKTVQIEETKTIHPQIRMNISRNRRRSKSSVVLRNQNNMDKIQDPII